MTFEDEDKRGLHSIGIDRTDERAHLLSAFATEYALSPDEKWVAFREKFNAYIAPFVRTGKTIDIGPDTKSIPVAKVTKEAGEYLHWSGDSLAPLLVARPRAFLARSEGLLRLHRRRAGEAARRSRDRHRTSASRSRPTSRPARSRSPARASSRCTATRSSRTARSSSTAIASPPSARARAPPFPPDAKVIDVAGKTIMPGIVDVHWHGAMGADEIIPQQSWVNYAALAFGVTTLHDPSNNSVRDLHRRRDAARRRDRRAAHLLDRHDPLRRQGSVQSRHRQPRRRALPPAPHESDRRDQREELQPAAPRSAPAGHRGGAPDRHDGGARGRLAVRAQHDDGGRRPHRRRALASRWRRRTTT